MCAIDSPWSRLVVVPPPNRGGSVNAPKWRLWAHVVVCDTSRRTHAHTAIMFGSAQWRADTSRRDPNAGAYPDFTDDTKAKVVKQIEFYLCDSNLPRDAFLLEQVTRAKADGFDGAVDLGIIAGFSRMREHLKAYGEASSVRNVEQIAKAISEASETLEIVHERRVKRKAVTFSGEAEPDMTNADQLKAYRDATLAELDTRSVFASPFAMESTIEALTEFFETVGAVKSIRLRRHMASKDFRGSIFVEFGTVEEAKAISERTDLVFDGATLKLMMKNDYLANKRAEQVERKAKMREEAIARGEDPDAPPPPPQEPVYVGKVSDRPMGGRVGGRGGWRGGGRGGGRGGPGRGRGRGGGGRGGRGRGGPDRGRFGGGDAPPSGDRPRFGRPY